MCLSQVRGIAVGGGCSQPEPDGWQGCRCQADAPHIERSLAAPTHRAQIMHGPFLMMLIDILLCVVCDIVQTLEKMIIRNREKLFEAAGFSTAS